MIADGIATVTIRPEPAANEAPGASETRRGFFFGGEVAHPTGSLFGDLRLSLAFLAWRRCGWIAALINRSTRGLRRHGNGIAFGFRNQGCLRLRR